MAVHLDIFLCERKSKLAELQHKFGQKFMLTGHPHITNFEARIHNSKIEKKKNHANFYAE